MALTNSQYDSIMREYDRRQYGNYRQQCARIDKIYENPDNGLRFFDRSVLLASGSIDKHQFVVRHTRSNRDCQIDIPRLERILEILKGRINGR